jgi:glycosyltransferase involved in cell wall biosynthesis
MGMELAELRLLEAIRTHARDVSIDVRVVGGRAALRHARRVNARWIPARPNTTPRIASAWGDMIHLLALDVPPPRGKPFVVMIHDLSPLHFDDEGTLPLWIGRIAQDAALVLTPSRFTADEVRRHLGVPEERVRVIGGAPALEAAQSPRLTDSELGELGITTPFALRYGGYTKRKNVPLLLEAWSRVAVGTLVLAGPRHPSRERILAGAAHDRVVILDYVPETLLARLLRTAAVLVSTSSYEGFGLPLVEALAAGTPVVAVSEPFVGEVCGDAAYLVEPTVEALAEAIACVLLDSTIARSLSDVGRLRAEKYSWTRVADRVLSAYSYAATA